MHVPFVPKSTLEISSLVLFSRTMDYQGTHGTSETRMQSIVTGGFKPPTGPGRSGKGVYFWAYVGLDTDVMGQLAEDLAKTWFEFASKRGDFSADKSQRCGVLWISGTLPPDQCLSCESMKFQALVIQMLSKAHPDETEFSTQQISSATDAAIEFIEQGLKRKIDLILAKVPAPKGWSWRNKFGVILGFPAVYVFRGQFDKIGIVKTQLH
jgi:hypothetical protein